VRDETIGWFGSDVVDAFGDAVAFTGHVFVDYLTPIGLVAHPSQIANEWADAIDAIGDLASDIKAHFKEILRYTSMALSAVAGVVSFVPGIGTAVGAVLNVAAAVAAGKDLTDIAISAVAGAVPGGAIVQMAVQAGAAAVKGIANGESIDAIGLDAARGALSAIPGVGPEALAAFDMAAAIAHGKDLQDAGFAIVKDLVPGGDLAQQAVEFSNRAVHAAREGKDLESYLQDEVVADINANLPALAAGVGGALDDVAHKLPELVSDKADELLERFSSDPDLLHENADAWAAALGVPEPVARAARALISVEQAAESQLPALSINEARHAALMAKLVPAREREGASVKRALKTAPVSVAATLAANTRAKEASRVFTPARVSVVDILRARPARDKIATRVQPGVAAALVSPVKVAAPAPAAAPIPAPRSSSARVAILSLGAPRSPAP